MEIREGRTMNEPQQITSCADRSCPSRFECKRYAANGCGVADFNRAEGEKKCQDGFESCLTPALNPL